MPLLLHSSLQPNCKQVFDLRLINPFISQQSTWVWLVQRAKLYHRFFKAKQKSPHLASECPEKALLTIIRKGEFAALRPNGGCGDATLPKGRPRRGSA